MLWEIWEIVNESIAPGAGLCNVILETPSVIVGICNVDFNASTLEAADRARPCCAAF
jgi:hypothetical protein